MSVTCAKVEFILSPPKARWPCLQRACKVHDTHLLQSKYVVAASSVSCLPRWHWVRTLEARLSRSRLALNLYLPAAQTVPATHVRGAPPCAACTCLLFSCRRCSAGSSYCTLFNNPWMLSVCSCISQNMHRRRALLVRFSVFRLSNPTQTHRREVHGGLWPRFNLCGWGMGHLVWVQSDSNVPPFCHHAVGKLHAIRLWCISRRCNITYAILTSYHNYSWITVMHVLLYSIYVFLSQQKDLNSW